MRSFTGDELFIDNGTYMDFSLSDFWQWYASDLLNHPIRGAIAEFLVAKAIGVPTDSRPGWRSYDLLYKGKKIEIKSCARVSDSHGGRNNRICFVIPKQLCLWDEDVKDGVCTKEQLWKYECRHSDLYVFCFLAESDPLKANPMEIDQWEFYILQTFIIDRDLGDRKTVRIPTILELGGIKCSWYELRGRIESLICNRKQ